MLVKSSPANSSLARSGPPGLLRPGVVLSVISRPEARVLLRQHPAGACTVQTRGRTQIRRGSAGPRRPGSVRMVVYGVVGHKRTGVMMRLRGSGILAATAAALAIALSGCGSSSTAESAPAAAPVSASVSAGGAAQGTKTCTYTPAGGGTVSLPPSTADPAVSYTATLRTSQGDIVIKLRNAQAPCTVNSIVHLAHANFWAGTQCHRNSTDGGLYMLQCGDPTAKASETITCDGTAGSGGPGY